MNPGICGFPQDNTATLPEPLLGRPSSVHMPSEARGFTPHSISGLRLWFDASKADTLYTATVGGTTPTNGQGVGRWSDLSGNQFDAQQGTANNRPTLSARAINGLDALSFNGTTAYLYRRAQIIQQEVTVFLVAKSNSLSARCVFADLSRVGGGQDYFMVEQNTFQSVGQRMGFYSSNNSYDTTIATRLTPQIICVAARTLPASVISTAVRYRVNGTRTSLTIKATNGNDLFANLAATNGFAIGSPNTDNAGALVPLNGLIGEMIVYRRELTASDCATVERYLGNKWGIAVT